MPVMGVPAHHNERFEPKRSQALAKVPVPHIEHTNPLKVVAMFGLWYVLNVGYNVYNKKVLNAIPELTYTVAFLQLAVGMLFMSPLWLLGIRKFPPVQKEDLRPLSVVALFHLLTHLGAVVSVGAGAISFTSVVKAAEPAVSAALAGVFFGTILPVPVYLSLVPLMVGVGLAAAGEMSFSARSFTAAMLSNVASAARALTGKRSMGKNAARQMEPSGLYAVTTLLACCGALPLCAVLEGRRVLPTVNALRAAGKHRTVTVHTMLSALFYYLYNEVAFLTLDKVSPITHAVGNTIKRVVIILASVLVFGTKLTTQGAVGSTLAVGGVLLYSLVKSRYESL
jgi:solute carrier family 35 protein E1